MNFIKRLMQIKEQQLYLELQRTNNIYKILQELIKLNKKINKKKKK